MSAADSDHSLHWLASDEDDCESPKKAGPEHVELPPPPSSSTASSRKPARSSRSGASKRRRSDCEDGDASRPLRGFTGSTGWDGPDTQHGRFSHKRVELQRYLQPLSSILRGLRSGRYSGRLSSFQESVAMDRIQRIMGVIQSPDMGGRFFPVLLKMEEMLQSWFPHVKATQADGSAAAKKQKQQHPSSASPPAPVCSSAAESYSPFHLRRLHASPACSLKAPEPRPCLAAAPPARRSQEVTQDNAVSSSTDSHAGPRRRLSRGPLPFQISSPCLERLLQAKESIIAPRTVGEEGWLSWQPADS